MINIREDLIETIAMMQVFIDQIDDFYSVNSTLIRDVKPDSAKFVLEKAKACLLHRL